MLYFLIGGYINMKKEKSKKGIFDSKYFKWGLTAFLVFVASICFIFVVYNADRLTSILGKFVRVLKPIIYGLVIAYLLNPIVRFFEVNLLEKTYIKHGITVTAGRKKRFRVFSIILTFLIVFYLLFAFFGYVLPQIYTSIQSIVTRLPLYINNISNSLDEFVGNNSLFKTTNFDELIDGFVPEFKDYFNNNIVTNLRNLLPQIKPYISNVTSALTTGLMTVFGAFMNIIIGLIVSIYLLNSKEKYTGLFKKIIYSILPNEKANNMMVDIRFINQTFGGFIVGKVVDSLIVGILCFIGLNFMHMPYAVLVSVIVGITNIIPFFGPYLGAIPSAILILLVNPMQSVYFLIFVIILQQLDGNIIGPAILGNSIGLSSFWIIVAITFFGGYFGLLGMIVGVPIFACMYAFIRRRVNNRLRRNNMPVATLEYASAKYIDKKNNIVPIDNLKTGKKRYVEDKSSPLYEHYIELNPSALVEKKDSKVKIVIKGILSNVFEFFKSIMCKVKMEYNNKIGKKKDKVNITDDTNENITIMSDEDITADKIEE